MRIQGFDVTAENANITIANAFGVINGGDQRRSIIYDAMAAPQVEDVNAQIANVIFTVSWYKADEGNGQYTLTLEPSEYGELTDETYAAEGNTVYKIYAGANEGYAFSAWRLNGSYALVSERTSNPLEIRLLRNTTVSGNYGKAPTSVSLDGDTEVILGEEIMLTATALPEDSANRSVSWRSGNPDVATMDAYGVVTSVSAGTAVITAETVNGITAELTITVNPGPPDSVNISGDTTVTVGETITLTAAVQPDDADQTMTWHSSDTDIATVSDAGAVTGVNAGTVTITAETANGLTASVSVEIGFLL